MLSILFRSIPFNGYSLELWHSHRFNSLIWAVVDVNVEDAFGLHDVIRQEDDLADIKGLNIPHYVLTAASEAEAFAGADMKEGA